MIKLSDISTSKLKAKLFNRHKECYYRLGENSQPALDCLKTLEIFEKHNIETYQDLKNMIDLFQTSKSFHFIVNDLKNVERKLSEANNLGMEPEIYTSQLSEGINVDDRILHTADKETTGDVLLMTNPLKPSNPKQRILNYTPIADIKSSLCHLQSDLRNEFRFDSGCYSREDAEKLVQVIKFYNQQLERQANELKENDYGLLSTNVFYNNNAEKRFIVESQLTEIAEYLIESGNLFVWGKLNDKDKKRLLNVINKPYHFAKRNFINAISNYTTLSELELGVVKKKTLDRFIIR